MSKGESVNEKGQKTLTRPSGKHLSGYVSYVVKDPSGSEKLQETHNGQPAEFSNPN